MQQSLRVLLSDVDFVSSATLIEQARVARRAFESKPAAAPKPAGLSLTIRGLSKSFAQNEVLRGIDLHIPAGQFVAIVGKSGCGKSTLLRLIARLETPTAGTIEFSEPTRAEDVRVMFQEPRLLPWATVGANVEVGLIRERLRTNAKARAGQALEEVGLHDNRDQWPSVLSGGQKQRVALARALVSHPRVLAFDEPLGALDALTRISMQRLLERVWADQAFTAILVTHDVAEAVALADRVLVIEQGHIAHDVTVDIARPRQRGSADLGALEATILNYLLTENQTTVGE
ncbi:MAG TPA: ATP-binding cassette domain-containing protein [Nitrobacter sp.]|jgi:sulfonate transport system ATP-binding protein|nr:ATP-binding cassette domain-containing protein [Nitrobacter sp.]